MKKIFVTGNVGKDPEVRYAPSGESFVTFSLAVSSGTKANPRTDWLECSANGEKVKTIQEYVKKGTKLLIEGSPSVSAYINKEGKPVATLKISIYTFEFIGSKQQENTAEPAEGDSEPSRQGFNAPAPSLQPDDIPF